MTAFARLADWFRRLLLGPVRPDVAHRRAMAALGRATRT